MATGLEPAALLESKVQLDRSVSARHGAGDQLGLKARRKSVGKLNLGVQGIGSVPALGQCQASALVSVFTFQGGRRLTTGNVTLGAESDTVWSHSFQVQGNRSVVVEVLAEDVVGWFSNV
ncbi:hypothetical protein OGATHE_003540 [Ogataea polymorpha]|uniref:Uncharacterized protein n=1 Tax=Ogataea polymorpha TaxID=460523 RepID=A0A9P8P3T6_9ASCO|nr:hypothetical protein OGATHE_003540 [Ogataea polymorpha]